MIDSRSSAGRLVEEHDRTVQAVRTIRGVGALPSGNPVLRASIESRDQLASDRL